MLHWETLDQCGVQETCRRYNYLTAALLTGCSVYAPASSCKKDAAHVARNKYQTYTADN